MWECFWLLKNRSQEFIKRKVLKLLSFPFMALNILDAEIGLCLQQIQQLKPWRLNKLNTHTQIAQFIASAFPDLYGAQCLIKMVYN